MLDRVTINGYRWIVKASELRRWLRKQGCAFVEESRHTRIVLGSKISRMPPPSGEGDQNGDIAEYLKISI